MPKEETTFLEIEDYKERRMEEGDISYLVASTEEVCQEILDKEKAEQEKEQKKIAKEEKAVGIKEQVENFKKNKKDKDSEAEFSFENTKDFLELKGLSYNIFDMETVMFGFYTKEEGRIFKEGRIFMERRLREIAKEKLFCCITNIDVKYSCIVCDSIFHQYSITATGLKLKE